MKNLRRAAKKRCERKSLILERAASSREIKGARREKAWRVGRSEIGFIRGRTTARARAAPKFFFSFSLWYTRARFSAKYFAQAQITSFFFSTKSSQLFFVQKTNIVRPTSLSVYHESTRNFLYIHRRGSEVKLAVKSNWSRMSARRTVSMGKSSF